MPAQDGVGSEDGTDFGQQLAAQDFAFEGEASALVVVQENAAFTELLLQDLVLGAKEINHLLLSVVDPPRHARYEDVPRFDDEVHRSRLTIGRAGRCPSIGSWNGVCQSSDRSNRLENQTRKLNRDRHLHIG